MKQTIKYIKDGITYFWNMITEPSSLAAIAAGATAAAAVSAPWSYVIMGGAVLGVFRKEKGKDRLPCSDSQ